MATGRGTRDRERHVRAPVPPLGRPARLPDHTSSSDGHGGESIIDFRPTGVTDR
ncbi:MAG: hypothetical protein AVDCRST_MAG52-1542 [uncultured Blastococcus sp.]|uniref:Uncharacterized protein n=1 Tax=uncultured Blastococcus sp. TaxID=217144 RepID=A0A6J4I062_9ACTN|nr:MAG: hypothetical protein AVDCRST_MAG52-1542 [uncultured Blastococcus sp.]